MRNITIILISLILISFVGVGCASLPAIQEINKRDAPQVQKIIENIANKYKNSEYYISFSTINNTNYAFAFKKPNRVFIRVGCCLLFVSNEKELIAYDFKNKNYVHMVPPPPPHSGNILDTLGTEIKKLLLSYSIFPGSYSYIRVPSDVSMLLSDGFEKISGGSYFSIRLYQFIHSRNALLDGWVDQFNIELLGESVLNDHDCYVLKMFIHWEKTSPGIENTETYRFWVDKESFLIKIVETEFTRPEPIEKYFITLNPEDVPNNVLLLGKYGSEVIVGSRLDDLFYPKIPASWKQVHNFDYSRKTRP